MKVIIRDDESFERALKRFGPKCQDGESLWELRRHRHVEKRSERRKRNHAAAARKDRREQAP